MQMLFPSGVADPVNSCGIMEYLWNIYEKELFSCK